MSFILIRSVLSDSETVEIPVKGTVSIACLYELFFRIDARAPSLCLD
nr:MAG TPA: hypothetical protein [Caudoviricetes sp.]